MNYSTLILFGQMKVYSPVLPQLTQTWGQRSSRAISGTCKNRVKWTKSAIAQHLEKTTRPIIANLIKHSMDSRSMVVMTPKVKVYGSKVKFLTCSYGAEIWHGWSLRHPDYVKILCKSFKVMKGSLWGHFRFDTKCSNWAEIWYEWSLGKSKHT